MRRQVWAAAAALMVLAGCATIPHEGPVEEGNADISPVEPLVPIQEGPDPTAGPEAIVTGFLTASGSGVATGFDVAREFLLPETAAAWDPSAETLVYSSGTVSPVWDQTSSTVRYEVPLASTIDESGRRADAADGEVVPLEFSLRKDSAGRWRIAELADGVVITEANFNRFFRAVDLTFATVDRTTIVPELRWLPDSNVATAAARELLEGPSTWLADAVETGFPAGAALAVESVVVTDGIATVDLTSQSAGTPEDRALAEAQMVATLTGLPNVVAVDVRIGGLPIVSGGTVTLANAPVPDAQAAALVQGRLGAWDGEQLWVTPDALGGVGTDVYGLARSYDGDAIAYVAGGGSDVSVSTVASGTGPTLIPVQPEMPELEQAAEATVVHEGSALVPPSFDRHGFLWTAERNGAGGIVAVPPEGETVALVAEWLQTRSVVALSVSRDGARIAVLSRAGGQPLVEVAGVVRDESGAPLSVGEPIRVGSGVGAGVDLVWIDDVTLGVLGEPLEGAASTLWQAVVGGGTTDTASLRDAVLLTVRSGETTLVVVASDGRVEERSGTSWAVVLNGVTELAYSG